MKKQLVIFLVLFSLSFTGCKKLIVYHAGIRTPREETAESILKYARGMNQDTSRIYILKDSSAFSALNRDSVMRVNLLGAIVFSKNGLVTNYRDSSSCQWSAARYIGIMKPDSGFQIDTGYTWHHILNAIVPLTGGVPAEFDTSKYDYLVVFSWAKFITKMNERLFLINQSAAENPYSKIKVISLNIDMQKSWCLKEDQKFKFR